MSRLLLIDDDARLTSMVADYLRGHGFEVQVAGSLGIGREHLARESYDGLVLDLMLPGVDGFEVCQRIKSDPQTCGAHVIAMTAYRSPENAARAHAAGAEQCLAKPLDAIAVITLVENLIRQAPAEG